VNKFTVGQRAEIFSPVVAPSHHRTLCHVLTESGDDSTYLVMLDSGRMMVVAEEFLRPFPPVLENGRGDIDTKVSWESFEQATGIPADDIRGTDSAYG